MIIETKNLKLLSLTEEMYKALKNNNEYNKIKCKNTWPPEQVNKIIEEDFKEYEGMIELMKWSVWIIVEKKSNNLIGDIGYKGVPDFDGMVEIGYGVDKEYRRRGYCYEAALALIDMALSDIRVDYVTAECLKENTASSNILKKLKFEVASEDQSNYYWTNKKN